jgi:hypothetical protein
MAIVSYTGDPHLDFEDINVLVCAALNKTTEAKDERNTHINIQRVS